MTRSRLRLGISSHAFRWAAGWCDVVSSGRMSIARFIDQSLSIPGVEGVQICDNIGAHRLAQPGEDRRKVEEAVARGFFVELGAAGTEPAHLEALLRLSGELAADVLRVLPSARRDERGEAEKQDLDKAERDLREVLPTARGLGVRLALENHWEVPSQALLELVTRINDEHLGICLDTANPVCGGEDPLRTTELLAPYAINVHLKDFRATRDLTRDPAGYRIIGVAFGEGWLPAEAVIDVIQSKSPAQTFHVELFLDRAETEPETLARERGAVRRSVENARRLLGLC